ncbi:hypothetical protein SISSUDRAFT_1123545 [Sistotremastrum suecicum HHB10207 ss-3]|uniref:F-box domain-containing protein n=1 Tax=Sistotremastrum suecicum HHB10207 ss-3 TaxID=1314776 RepID=A0A165XGH6_9AGAM|nr:hypothetical protein SISSUDRAFT_1123545 [Sistotremastrum suecicum HHB10207 ss-3]
MPFSSLTEDCLLRIIHCVLEEAWFREEHDKIAELALTLASINHKLRALALSTPIIWSKIRVNWPSRIRDEFLQWSGSEAFMYLDTKKALENRPNDVDWALGEWPGIIGSNVHALKGLDLTIHNTKWSDVLSPVMRLPAPNLEVLKVNCQAYLVDARENLFGDQAPHLRIIEIHSSRFWKLSSLSSLSSATMTICRDNYRQLLAELERLPSLQIIHLVATRHEDAIPSSLQHIRFSSCRELRIEGMTTSALHRLLTALRLPLSPRLHIEEVMLKSSLTSPRPTNSTPVRALQMSDTSINATGLYFALHPRRIILKVHGASISTFEADWGSVTTKDNNSANNTLDVVASMLTSLASVPGFQPTHLSVHNNIDPKKPSSTPLKAMSMSTLLERVFKKYPSITDLELTGRVHESISIIAGRSHFPKLKRVDAITVFKGNSSNAGLVQDITAITRRGEPVLKFRQWTSRT